MFPFFPRCPLIRSSEQSGLTRSRLSRLEEALAGFYRTEPAYTAFQPGAEHEGAGWHNLIVPLLAAFRGKPVRVLEIGAGRSGFGEALGSLRRSVTYHAQDITDANRGFLEAHADRVFIGPIETIEERYDLIFHTFVLEHVVFPERFLQTINRLLNPGGMHIVICPTYGLPGYINPSLRHHGLVTRIAHSLTLAMRRLFTRLGGNAEFLINSDPAVFHVPWYRDADAVHLVSGFEIDLWHRRRGYRLKRLQPIICSFRDRLFKRLCLLATAYRKPG